MAASTRVFILCKSPSKSALYSCLHNHIHRHLYLSSCLGQETTATQKPQKEIHIPKKKNRDPTSVLQALSSTVKRDPTASPYMFHDDPFLLPRNSGERRRYALAAESGRKAAQYVINKWPEHFLAVQRDSPKVEAFYPPEKHYLFGDPSEEAVLERVENSDMKEALEMFYKLLDTGSAVSMETSNALLDLLCYHGYSGEPMPEEQGASAEAEASENSESTESTDPSEADSKGQAWKKRKTGREARWKENNDIEKLFNTLQERNAHAYCSMVRGMIKHGAATKAFIMYNEMQERGIQADVQTYNALIKGVVYIREDYMERWKVIYQLMKQMHLEGVRPNLSTFNTMLDDLRIMGVVGRKKALQTVSEMKAIGVEPSLGTYNLLLMIFYKDSLPPSDVLYDIMDTIDGTSFSLRHEQDVFFFKNAMNICLSLKDLELAYRVDLLLNTGENYKLAGDYFAQNVYYGKFFNLICLMDSVDAMMEYYEKLVPSALIPNAQVYIEMLRSMETAGTYDKAAVIWKDICHFSHHYRQPLLETLLSVMSQATDADNKLTSEFFDIAMEIKLVIAASKSRRDPVEWRSSSLTHLALICLKAKQLDKAWEVLDLFKEENKLPGNILLEEYLEACIEASDNQKAISCLQFVSSVSSTLALQFIDRVKGQLTLLPQERKKIDAILAEEDLDEAGAQ
ncbi:pentatricopeptide repeat domain-containing protein 3, mitochondrial-like [Acanthaster planci]|uniref:Small ribosomal subunit protein mS39 n=1 Tax=Acanthaster planci TaxID=133434 RepID=A0A8B7XKM0_ACAPL|nr:pentatricopeptide repeat domain-containing protein 3, mitochondrial-like [Acanthaster planci]